MSEARSLPHANSPHARMHAVPAGYIYFVDIMAQDAWNRSSGATKKMQHAMHFE